MPLEIRELVIRTAINAQNSQVNQLGQSTTEEISQETQRKMIAACVKQVLATLRSRPER